MACRRSSQGPIWPARSCRAAADQGQPLVDGDVVVVTSKIVSKAEGRTVELADVEPSPFAREWSAQWGKDPAVTELVLRESKRIVRQLGPDPDHRDAPRLRVREQRHRPVERRRARPGRAAASGLRRVGASAFAPGFARRPASNAAVIISDTFGRAWREGQTDIAIGIAGMQPILSYIGQVDPHGHEFMVQALCTADELAGAAELVKGNLSRVPVAVIRGHAWEQDDTATIAPVLRDQSRDLFR